MLYAIALLLLRVVQAQDGSLDSFTRPSVTTSTPTATSSVSTIPTGSVLLSGSPTLTLPISSAGLQSSPISSSILQIPTQIPGPSGDSILGCHPEQPPTRLKEETVKKEGDHFITHRSYDDGSTMTIDENGKISLKITTIKCPDGSRQVATERGNKSETIIVTESEKKGLRITETEIEGRLRHREAVDLSPPPQWTANKASAMGSSAQETKSGATSSPEATSVQPPKDQNLNFRSHGVTHRAITASILLVACPLFCLFL